MWAALSSLPPRSPPTAPFFLSPTLGFFSPSPVAMAGSWTAPGPNSRLTSLTPAAPVPTEITFPLGSSPKLCRILGMNRRTFIESSVAAAAVTSLPFRGLPAAHQVDPIGMQLYTVRGMMGTDVPGTIAKVAKIGYKEVEFAGYPYLYSPKDLRSILNANGLSSPSVHVSYDVVHHRIPQAIEAAHVLGHKYIICPWIDDSQRASPDGYKRAAELFNKAGEACHKAGLQFGYHNHFWEFLPDKNLGDKLPYDFLLESCDAANLTMELDLCWITVAKKHPVAYFKKYPGRISEVHIKDLKRIP